MTSLKNLNKISAVIPFYNEEKHIQKIVSHVLNFVDTLILVNDGSTDLSVSEIPTSEKIHLLNHNMNLGKGRALKTGILKSIELKSNITITLDADCQHDPEKIPFFVKELNNYDFVIGSRIRNKSTMPLHRRASNYLTSKLLSIKTGNRIIDSQSGYRAIKTEKAFQILPEFDGFEAESEMIVKACKNNYSIGFVNIPTIYGDEESKMKPLQTIFGFLKVIVRT